MINTAIAAKSQAQYLDDSRSGLSRAEPCIIQIALRREGGALQIEENRGKLSSLRAIISLTEDHKN